MVRSFFATLAWILVGAAALVASVVGHLHTDRAREVARDHALDLVNAGLVGRIEVGRVARLGPRHIRLEDVRVRDPQGRVVIEAATVAARPDLWSILRGVIRIEDVRIVDGSIRLHSTPDGDLSLVRAFDPAEPSEDTEMPGPTVVVDGFRAEGMALHTSMAPVGLRAIALRADVRVEDGHTFLRVPEGRATVVHEGKEVARLASLRGDLRTPPGAESELQLELLSGGDRLALAGTTVLEPASGEPEGPSVDALLRLDPLSPATLRRAGLGDAAASLATDVRGSIAVRGSPQDLTARADLATDGGPVRLRARVTGMRHLEATVRTPGLALDRIVSDGPPMRVGGEARAEVVPLDEAPREVTIDATSVAVDDYRIPSLRLGAQVAEDHVRIRELAAPYLDGQLDVQGRVGFDGDADLAVRAHIPDLAQEPNLRRLAPGLGGALRTDLNLRYRQDPDPRIRAHGEVVLTGARIADVRASRLHVRGRVRGDPAEPRVDAEVTAAKLRMPDLDLGDVTVAARGGPRRYRIHLGVDAPGERNVRLDGRVRAAGGGYVLDADLLAVGVADQTWRGDIERLVFMPDRKVEVARLVLASGPQRLQVEGSYGLGPDPQVAASVMVQRMDLALLDAIPEVPDLPVEGQVDLMATAEGDADLPEIVVEGGWTDGRVDRVPIETGGLYALWNPREERVAVNASIRTPGSGGPLAVELDATYEDTKAEARLHAWGEEGDLAVVAAEANVDLMALLREPDALADRMLQAPWEIHARIPPQRLDRLPAPLASATDLPASAWVTAHLVGRPGRPIRADLDGALTWLEPVAQAGLDADRCTGDAEPRLTLEGRLRNGRAETRVRGYLHGTEVLRAEARAPVAVDAWIEEGLPAAPPPVDARVRLVEADLQAVPEVCRYASGELSAQLDATGLFTAEPAAELAAHSADVVAMDAPPMRLDLQATAGTEHLRADLSLDAQRGDEGARVKAVVPIHWGDQHPIPALRDGAPLRADVDLHRTPLGPLLAPVPGVGYASGVVDGRVVVRGAGRDVRFDGGIRLEDVTVSLLESGNRLEEVRGRLAFEGQTIRMDGLRAHDRGGTVVLDGRLAMEGLVPRRGEVQIEASQFPVRRAGLVIARVGTRTRADLRLGDEAGRARVVIDEMRVELEGLDVPQVQSLEDHPDVVLAGREMEATETGEDAAVEDPYELLIDVRTANPMWVRRPDMAAQLEARLQVRSAEQTTISGRVKLIRGWFELVGKRFDLEEGHIEFTGGAEVDPVVELAATYDLGGGEELMIQISGNVSDPQLSFSSTSGDVTTMSEAVALLLGGREGGAGEQGLASQAASVVSGITAGILTTTLRRELGDVFPVISVEAGDQTGTGTVRAGIDADQLIPDFLDDVIEGAYVEGFVTSGGDSTQAQGDGTSGGFLVEFRFPRDITGTVTFEPPQAWSADVMWEP
ncbi:MAG: translocation/assembly module TamB domain-containing protein [Myxococcota bacterium]